MSKNSVAQIMSPLTGSIDQVSRAAYGGRVQQDALQSTANSIMYPKTMDPVKAPLSPDQQASAERMNNKDPNAVATYGAAGTSRAGYRAKTASTGLVANTLNLSSQTLTGN